MVRFAEEKDLPRVNELRRQVSDLHVNGRPDIFRPGFCKELQERVYELWRDENSDVIIAERDGVICGMACVEYLKKQESPYSRERSVYLYQRVRCGRGLPPPGRGPGIDELPAG